MQSARQRDLHTVGEEGDEDMSFDSAFTMMQGRAGRQVALQVFERLLRRDEWAGSWLVKLV